MAEISQESNQYVSFVLQGEEYCIPILSVREIIRFETLTAIPQSPPFIDGVLNLRGQVIPVINLRTKFGMSSNASDKSTRIVVVEVKHRIIGLIVDEVNEVHDILPDRIAPPPPIGANVNTDFMKGMGKMEDSLMIMLDIDKILTTEEQTLLEKTDI